MFARALNEFMLRPEPYTGRLYCLGTSEVVGETVGQLRVACAESCLCFG